MSHTPGPWRLTDDVPPDAPAHDAEGATIVATFGDLTVYSKYSTKAHSRQDAELFMAAPDLLEACKTMVANIDNWLLTGVPADAQESQILHHQMTAAIAKAEGK